MAFGEPGSGKTSTIRKVILGMHGDTGAEKSISAMTPFTLMKTANGSNCFPLFLDEYKPSRLNQHKKDMVSEYVRASYNNLTGDRGQKDMSKIQFPYRAPTVIAGEDQFTEVAARERILEVQFSKQSSKRYAGTFSKLMTMNLLPFGRSVLDYCLSMSDADVKALYENTLKSVDERFTDRVRVNVALGAFGLNVLRQLSAKYGYEFSVSQKHLEQGQYQRLLAGNYNALSNVDRIVERIIEIIGQQRKLQGHVTRTITEHEHFFAKDKVIKIHVPSVYPEFTKWAKDHGFEGDVLTSLGFINQICHESYYIDYKKSQIAPNTNVTKLVLILAVPAMLHKGLDIGWLAEACNVTQDNDIINEEPVKSDETPVYACELSLADMEF